MTPSRSSLDLVRSTAITLGARVPARPVLALMRTLTRIRLRPGELRAIARVVRSRAPCNFLVFGLGNDSAFWRELNRGGRTVFLEDIPEWYEKASARDSSIRAYLVDYRSRLSEWRELLGSSAVYDLALPSEVRETLWDVILVDAPMGWTDSKPGRMKSIAAASRLAREHGSIFVHDCDREVERVFASAYLKEENLVRAWKRLRLYRGSAQPRTEARSGHS